MDSPVDMADYSINDFRWLEDEADLDLSLDNYHDAIAETARRQASTPQKRSFRRNVSLSSVSLRRSSGSSSRAAAQVGSAAASSVPSSAMPLKSPHPSSFPLRHRRSQASLSSIDPRATHYQDPATRMKLRLYLASPQKFDEAVEFGFPSIRDQDHPNRKRPMTCPQRKLEVGRTFFNDDTPSLSGDEGEDRDEPETLYDPRTPEDSVFQMHRPSRKESSTADSISRPHLHRGPSESHPVGTTTDREPTLFLSLTRPDLRSPEDRPLSPAFVPVNALPLEQPDLTAMGNHDSIWDTLPPEESKVKKFLRRLKFK